MDPVSLGASSCREGKLALGRDTAELEVLLNMAKAKTSLKEVVLKRWQMSWNERNKLVYNVQNTVGPGRSTGWKRREENII